MIGNAFYLAVRQIARNPMRSLLTVLGVIIGVASVITMITVGNGVTQSVKAQIEAFGNNQLLIRPGLRLGPGQSVKAPTFKMSDVQALENQIAGITNIAPQAGTSLTVINQGRNWQTRVTGTTNAYFDIDNRSLEAGRYFEAGELRAGSAVCVIGKTIQKELFGENANVIGQPLRVGSMTCHIVGLLASKGTAAMGGDQDDIVAMPLQTMQRRLLGNNRVNAILLAINEDSDRQHLKDQITDLLRERRQLSTGDDDNFQILDTVEVAERVGNTTAILAKMLTAVAAVSLLVGGVGIMNIMLVSVTERTREIGIRLAIGARTQDVLWQFLIESLMLGVLGGVLGVVIALGASLALAHALGVNFLFNLPINLIAFTVAALTGMVFGFFPARRAARLDPIEAVRHE